MKKESVTLLGVGDIIIEREQPETIFQYTAEVLRRADITYANCDQVYSDKGHRSLEQATYSDPKNIPALLNAGLDVISLANNHTLDWGQAALLDTMVRLKEAGLPYVGVGKNLAEARQPMTLERNGTKVGFLAYSCVHPQGFEAEDDKPGLAPVRVWTIYEQVDYGPGSPPRIITIPYKEDLAAMVDDIEKLKSQVDLVVMCLHWGQLILPRVIPMYCLDIGHAAVDAGADLILGTHAHILKGIEVYKDKVIFYSTGNFAAELGPSTKKDTMLKKLREIYGTADRTQSKNTLIAKAIIEGGKIKKVSFIPCYINEQNEPEIMTRSDPRGQGVFNYIKDISRSEDLPVHFSWYGDEVLITP